MCAYISECVCACMNVCVHVHVCGCAFMHVCVCMCVCVCIYVHVHSCMSVCACVRVCMCMHVTLPTARGSVCHKPSQCSHNREVCSICWLLLSNRRGGLHRDRLHTDGGKLAECLHVQASKQTTASVG